MCEEKHREKKKVDEMISTRFQFDLSLIIITHSLEGQTDRILLFPEKYAAFNLALRWFK